MAKEKKSSRLSEHFTTRDFSCRCGNCNNEIKISLGLIGGLELLRSKLKSRINIIKGYQCPECADSTPKTRKNYHAYGIAADITVDKKDIHEVFQIAEEIPEFKGIGINLTNNWVHVDTRKEEIRTLWVEKTDQYTPLDETNRKEYLGSTK